MSQISVFLALLCHMASTAPLTILDSVKYPNARCLDGSQFGLYVKLAAGGSDAPEGKWLVVLNGGGLCTHESDCVERSKTELGSSKHFTPQFNFSSLSFTSGVPFDDAFRVALAPLFDLSWKNRWF